MANVIEVALLNWRHNAGKSGRPGDRRRRLHIEKAMGYALPQIRAEREWNGLGATGFGGLWIEPVKVPGRGRAF